MKKLALHWKILIGMILGIIFGFIMNSVDGGKGFVTDWIKPFGTIFINLLKLIQQLKPLPFVFPSYNMQNLL